MKKFLMMLACTALLVCSFALVAGAVTFEKLSDPIDGMGQMHIFGDESNDTEEHCDGWYASNTPGKSNNDKVARVELVYTKNSKEYVVTYPTYYILKNDSTLTFDFGTLSEYLGVTLGVTNIRKIEIPYGTTVIPKACFAAHFDETSTTTDHTDTLTWITKHLHMFTLKIQFWKLAILLLHTALI